MNGPERHLAAVPDEQTTETPATTGVSSCPGDDPMVCDCPIHAAEREHAVARGVRPRRPFPTRKAAA